MALVSTAARGRARIDVSQFLHDGSARKLGLVQALAEPTSAFTPPIPLGRSSAVGFHLTFKPEREISAGDSAARRSDHAHVPVNTSAYGEYGVQDAASQSTRVPRCCLA